MKFIDIINEANKTSVKKLTVGQDTILKELNDIYKSNDNLVKFLSHILPPKAVDRKKRFVYRIEERDDNNRLIGAGEYGIRFNDDKSKQPSEDFKEIINKIKSPKPTEWKKLFNRACEDLDDATQQDFIQTIFIPKVNNPATIVDDKGTGSTGRDYEHAYELLGKCMVFYAGKAVSKLADIDTEISKDKFQDILQGCFGAAPSAFGENESFLNQFTNPRAKLMIDAAKCALNSVRQNGDIEGEETDESYFNSITSLLPILFEAEELVNTSDFVELPKKVEDFVRDDAGKALIQAKNIAKKYPRQYKIWFEKLEAAFNRGMKEEQDIERDPDKTEFINPLTGKKEKRHGKAWGTGGPNGFIRDNPYLKKLVDDIKGQKWNMFNCGAKIILGIFDAIEHGGKIYQKLCDDLGEGFNQVKHSFNKTTSKDFDKLIEKYKKDGKGNDAYSASMAAVICALTATYQLLGQGKIGTINAYHKTFTTTDVNNTTAIQNSIDNLLDTLESHSRNEEEYKKWRAEKDKEIEEKITKQKEAIEKTEANGTSESQKGTKLESWKPVSMSMLLKEEEEKQEEKKKKSDIEKEIDGQKEELEKLQKTKEKKLNVNMEPYFALLDGYTQAVGHESEIADIYTYMVKMFDEDRAKEQEAKIYNKEQENKETADKDEEEKVESTLYKLNIKDPLLNEAGEDIDPAEEGNNDGKTEIKSNSKNSETSTEKKEMVGKRGNLDWIESGAGKALVNLYKLFGENTDATHLDLSKIKALAKTKKQEETLKQFSSMCSSLRDTLSGIDIRPIKDGIIAFDYSFGEDADKSKFKTLANAVNIEDLDEADKEKKNVKDKKDNEKKAGTLTVKELTQKRDELLQLTDQNSKIMKTVNNLTKFAKDAKDDSWLDAYKNLIKETDDTLKEIWDKCLEMYPEGNDKSESGRKWLLERREDAANQVFLNRIWYTLSCAKYIGQQITALLKKNKQKSANESFNWVIKSRLDEADNEKVSKSVNTLYNKIESIDFNFSDLLAGDIKDPKYDITKIKEFNAAEQDFANRLGMKGDTNDNHVFPMCRTIVLTDNAVSKAIKANKVKIPCKKLAEELMNTSRGKGLSTKSDRDIFLIYGLTVALANALYNGFEDNNLKSLDCNNPSNISAGSENSDAGAKENRPKPQNASYIPTYSKDSLINEIYKYLKG